MSLVSSTGTVTPIMEHELKRMPELFQHAELAPCKLVTTVKAPHGKRRAHMQGEQTLPPFRGSRMSADGTPVKCR